MLTGQDMYNLCIELFPICRSITGDGVRKTLQMLTEVYGNAINIHEVPTGTKVFDWTVPKEWNIKDAYIENSKGQRIIDFKDKEQNTEDNKMEEAPFPPE